MNPLVESDPVPAEILALLPSDEHNRTLRSNVHPPEWVNPDPAGRYNLVVVGAGTAGLVAAAGALASAVGSSSSAAAQGSRGATTR